MSKFTLTNARIFSGGLDATSNANKVELTATVEDKETTSFGSGGWKESIGGLFSLAATAEGQWEAGDASKVDDAMWTALGTSGGLTICPAGAVNPGDLAWVATGLPTSYKLGGAVGDVAPWSANWMGTGALARGVVGAEPTVRTATGNGTGLQVGAVPTGKSLYANLHVFSVSGTGSPTLTVVVKSSVDNTFASPTTRATFTAATAIGGQTARVLGAVTDAWWKVSWTITGTSPSFLFTVSLGIA